MNYFEWADRQAARFIVPAQVRAWNYLVQEQPLSEEERRQFTAAQILYDGQPLILVDP